MDLESTLAATRLPPSCTPDTKAKKNASTMPDVSRKCSTVCSLPRATQQRAKGVPRRQIFKCPGSLIFPGNLQRSGQAFLSVLFTGCKNKVQGARKREK